MKCIAMSIAAVAAQVCAHAALAPTPRAADEVAAEIAVGKLPAAYRDWRLISVAREEADLDDIRAVLGNDAAVAAYRQSTRPFREGTIIARLTWSYDASEEIKPSATSDRSSPAHPRTVCSPWSRIPPDTPPPAAGDTSN